MAIDNACLDYEECLLHVVIFIFILVLSTVPGEPQNFDCHVQDAKNAEVTWNPPTSHFSNYTLCYNVSGNLYRI